MTPASDPAAKPSEPTAGLAVPIARSVAEDLEAIFPHEPAAGAARSRRLQLGRGARGPGRRRSRERRAATVGGMIAAACVGLSAGALIARPIGPAKVSRAPDDAGAPPAPGPLASAAPGPLAPPVAPPASTVAPSATRSAPSEAPAAASDAAAQAARQAARPRDVAAVRPRPPAPRAAAHAGCGQARCEPDSLRLADARLRRAYASAVRAGVARPVLADYRAEWSRLRRSAPRQPRLVAARYRSMAGDLNQMAAHRRRTAHAAAPRPGPWRRFRMQLAALWR
jgi:hypothetical protein